MEVGPWKFFYGPYHPNSIRHDPVLWEFINYNKH